MSSDMEAVFLDVGGTLRIVVPDEAFQAAARLEFMQLVGAQGPEDAFFGQLEGRWEEYRAQSFSRLREASETELWTRWLLPDFPAGKIGPLHGRLTRLWRDRDGRRVPRPDVKATVLELSRRGYRLGIIANTITETEIPDWLDEDGLKDCFQAMVLSSIVGWRKPCTEIFLEACRRIGVEPARCAYVGDNPARDVPGARKAGFGTVLVLRDPGKPPKKPAGADAAADRVIGSCGELLDIFPPRKGGA